MLEHIDDLFVIYIRYKIHDNHRGVKVIVKHRLKQNGNNTSTADLTLHFVVCAKKRNRAKGDVLISGPVIVGH